MALVLDISNGILELDLHRMRERVSTRPPIAREAPSFLLEKRGLACQPPLGSGESVSDCVVVVVVVGVPEPWHRPPPPSLRRYAKPRPLSYMGTGHPLVWAGEEAWRGKGACGQRQ